MIFQKYFSQIKKFDWILLSIVLILVIFGLVAIYSIAVNADAPDYGLLIKQIIALVLGLILVFFLGFIDYRILRSYANLLYWLGVVLLTGVLIFGITVRGTRGWYSIFGQVFQPVEVVKILMIVFLSKYLTSKSSASFNFKNLWISFLFIIIPLGLVLLQPDLGSAAIFVVLWMGMIWLTKVKKSYMILIVAFLILSFLISWFFFLEDYQRDRIITFLQPNRDPLGQGYNITQSIIAVGSGQFWGRGLSLGPQSRLNFLPAKETDFIFSVIAEALGFVGSFFVIALFGLLFWRIVKIMRKSQDDFGIFLTWGVLLMIVVQVFINIGMNLGLAPVAGLPLPFISAGGSSLLVNLMAIGILQSIYLRQKRSVA
ncbi:MAG: rod shape-determining protein RodA [Candidatus Kerfeldbacteria bacterium CG_4_10_14_0_8_um_filter_42_10]|uniref:Rod shape-determining protein RodA n=1 Tax=Candidatus Kerfeldbacteria bacterium CG_4_10_14_0_8_um_filter_42_10 TaxID=2014248 RepID=A0A2M7RFQ2_9BACT|nr:MAG: rod shape-determining protein RodA [Candidatus Kerfeldbacteria bacterium CG_4_10_14_0_8_um_filter_42_10]